METRWDIFGVGTSAVDDLVFVERFPQPDEKMQVTFPPRQGGGQTATALVAAARQGMRAAYCGCLGDDDLSSFTIQALEDEGVDCTPVLHKPGCRPIHSLILVDAASESRTILYTTQGVREPEPEEIDPSWIQSSRLVFFDQNAPRSGLHAAQAARVQGIPVVADLERTTLPDMSQILASIDHLIVNIDFACRLTGRSRIEELMDALCQAPRTATVITAGKQGCWFKEQGQEMQYFPAFTVPVVDTTGCGDVFHGSYAAAIARGESVRRSVAIASATAALKATQAGGRAGIPSLPVVDEFLRARYF